MRWHFSEPLDARVFVLGILGKAHADISSIICLIRSVQALRSASISSSGRGGVNL